MIRTADTLLICGATMTTVPLHSSPLRVPARLSLLFVLVLCSLGIVTAAQPKVGSLSLRGNHALTERDLRTVMQMQEGEYYSRSGLDRDLAEITARYWREGFISVS